MNTNTTLQNKYDQQVARWLFIVAFTIFLMMILGAVTRLTHSGLSMVDWKPLMGIIPPFSDAEWLQTFHRYQQFPEYQEINHQMTLEGFKSIFYFEYFHRILGRLIGMMFLVPFLYFWFKGAIRKSHLPQMILMFLLGGLQGVLGWYMVKSGLVNDPRVSQYRLTAHLLAAVAIYSYLLWFAFGLIKDKTLVNINPYSSKLFKYAIGMVALVTLMIASGGFVAGTKAGLAYNTFPLMDGKLIPDGLNQLQPFWLNWLENTTSIQFNHRILAYILIILIPLFAFAVKNKGVTKNSQKASIAFMVMLAIQVTLGITTLLFFVPVTIAATHQAGAIILLSIAIYISRELKQE
jgi:cytochrome c oxidase assembly protein subunit 15